MQREEWFEAKWHYLRRFGPFAIGGLVCAVVGFGTNPTWLALIGFFLVAPWFVWMVLIPIHPGKTDTWASAPICGVRC